MGIDVEDDKEVDLSSGGDGPQTKEQGPTLIESLEFLVLPPVDALPDPFFVRGAHGTGIDTEELRAETSEALRKGAELIRIALGAATYGQQSSVADTEQRVFEALEDAALAAETQRYTSASSFTQLALTYLELVRHDAEIEHSEPLDHLASALGLLARFQEQPGEDAFPLVSAWAHIVTAESRLPAVSQPVFS